MPNSFKEAVTDLFHAAHPGSWGMTGLANRVWWPFCNRDLLNRVGLLKRAEFGKNLKPILPANKFKPLTPFVQPNQEIQLAFSSPIYDGLNKEI